MLYKKIIGVLNQFNESYSINHYITKDITMKNILFLTATLLFASSLSAQTHNRYRRAHREYIQSTEVVEVNNSYNSAADIVLGVIDIFHTLADNGAQYPVDKPSIGITGGLNIANTVDSYDPNYSTNGIVGFNVGVFATVPIISRLSFQPEVLISQKGYKAYTVDGTFTQRNNYIDIPLLANFRLVRGFDFLIGPQINIPISSTTTFDNGFNTFSESYYTDGSNKSYLAGVIGFSINLNRNVDIRARYVIDLTSNTYDVNSPIPDYRNQVWQIGLGIKFR